jgi:hypothetical protein
MLAVEYDGDRHRLDRATFAYHIERAQDLHEWSSRSFAPLAQGQCKRMGFRAYLPNHSPAIPAASSTHPTAASTAATFPRRRDRIQSLSAVMNARVLAGANR